MLTEDFCEGNHGFVLGCAAGAFEKHREKHHKEKYKEKYKENPAQFFGRACISRGNKAIILRKDNENCKPTQ